MVVANSKGPRPIGESIGLLFGGLWCHLGATSLPHGLQLPVDGLGIAVTLGLLVVLWRQRDRVASGTGMFRRRGYLVAVVVEGLAIFGVTVLMPRYGLQTYLVQAVGAIVGLHFVGLWQATRDVRFLWIAGCMCGVSALAALLPGAMGGFDARNAVTGLGNAIVLWVCAGLPRKAR
ncbi:hypothetical protein BH10PSE2_BH10PSE2_23740 [soil metagenome]